MLNSCCSQNSNQQFTFTNFIFFFFCFSVHFLSAMTGIKAGTAAVVHTTGSPKPECLMRAEEMPN